MGAGKNHGSKHHIRPTSRGGLKRPDNEIYLDNKAHKAWHTLFGNLLSEEIITLINSKSENGEIDEAFLETKRRQKAWKVVFGNTMNTQNVIAIIKQKFTKRT